MSDPRIPPPDPDQPPLPGHPQPDPNQPGGPGDEDQADLGSPDEQRRRPDELEGDDEDDAGAGTGRVGRHVDDYGR